MPEKDAQEIKEILEAVSDTVPKLLSEITDALFSPDKAEQFGASVAKFYKSMVDGARGAGSGSRAVMGGMGDGGGNINIGGHGHGCDDLGDKIEKKVKAKIERKFEDE